MGDAAQRIHVQFVNLNRNLGRPGEKTKLATEPGVVLQVPQVSLEFVEPRGRAPPSRTCRLAAGRERPDSTLTTTARIAAVATRGIELSSEAVSRWLLWAQTKGGRCSCRKPMQHWRN